MAYGYIQQQYGQFKPFILIGVLILVGVGAYLVVRFTPSLPSAILPSKNIFSVREYWVLLRSSVQKRNLLQLYEKQWGESFWYAGFYAVWCVLSWVLYLVAYIQGLLCVKRRKEEV